MKPLLPLMMTFILSCLVSFSQNQLVNSENFAAECKETTHMYAKQIYVYQHADSIIISGSYVDQCCAHFSLRISEDVADTIFVEFKDTALAQCDCICRYEIRINAGKYDTIVNKVNFNGKCYDILAEDYVPLVGAKKTWNVLYAVPGLGFSHPSLISYAMESDEGRYFCWNGKSYLKVGAKQKRSNGIHTDSLDRYIREENGRIYLLDTAGMAYDACNEVLIYDFTLQSGDTVYLGYDSTRFIVSHSGYNAELGRRYWYLVNDIMTMHPDLMPVPSAFWLEGIGDTRGLFESDRSLFIAGSYSVLTCFWWDDTLVYHNNNYPDCGDRPPYQFFIEEGKKWTMVNKIFYYPDTVFEVTETEITSENMTDNPYAMRFYPKPETEEIYFQENNGSVYYTENGNTFLIYDFTLYPGDSVRVGNIDVPYLYVDSIAYLTYADDALRKTMYLSGYPTISKGDVHIWVEGIGSLYKPLSYWEPELLYDHQMDFACCTRHEQLLYQDPGYPNCGVSLSQATTTYQSIRFYPNPGDGHLTISDIEKPEGYTYHIYTLTGSLLKTGMLRKEMHLELPKGMYVFSISDQVQKKIYTGKLMIAK